MVIKGAALFARDVSLSTRRMSYDYDILVSPGKRVAACETLQAAGYVPGQGFSWSEVTFGMPGRSGAPLRAVGAPSDIDLHWRPLQGIADPTLLDEFWAKSEEHLLNGRPVRVPALADHLFATLARPEPWDEEEAFQRLLEAYLVLTTWPDRVDWLRIGFLARRYSLRLRLRRLLSVLTSASGLRLPRNANTALSGRDRGERLDERLRGRRPEARRPLSRWFLEGRERRFNRQDRGQERLSLRHAFELQFGLLSDKEMLRQWRRAVELESGFPSAGVRFAMGFSVAEPTGRWTDGATAALRVPLPGGARSLSIPVLPYAKPRTSVQVRVCNGSMVATQTLQMSPDALPQLKVRAEPILSLGGDGLLLFDLAFAHSPASIQASPDIRVLGLFFPTSSTQSFGGLAG
jgi:hypothetical protein